VTIAACDIIALVLTTTAGRIGDRQCDQRGDGSRADFVMGTTQLARQLLIGMLA